MFGLVEFAKQDVGGHPAVTAVFKHLGRRKCLDYRITLQIEVQLATRVIPRYHYDWLCP